MNITKAAVIASTMLALSTQVFANDNTSTIHSNKVIKTADVTTKAEAYELGLNQLETLQANSSSELNKALGYVTHNTRSLVLDDGGYITVSEKMNANGETNYTGLVNVNVTYEMID